MTYNKTNPFLASIKNRYRLSKQGSDKFTHHVALDLSGSDITYRVGDSIAIFPVHDSLLVQRTLNAFHATGTEVVTDKHTGELIPLRTYLTKKGNITDINRKLFTEVAQRQTNKGKKAHLEFLLAEENKDALKEFMKNRELWDFLHDNAEVHFAVEELPHFLQPMLPRFYSIASSMKAVGHEVDLTVSYVKYTTNNHIRLGVCSHFLCDLMPLHQPVVPVYIQPHHGFTLPEDPAANIIMIGPGTGIAPYRAFMQERLVLNFTGHNWLFFGEWNREYDYFYEDFWADLQKQKKIRVDLAFSRDQGHKIYVQHRMLEQAEDLFKWLEKGAYIFVCGDAHRMAKDVETTLHRIIQEQGKMDELAARAYVKRLRAEKRYLRDVY